MRGLKTPWFAVTVYFKSDNFATSKETFYYIHKTSSTVFDCTYFIIPYV